MQFLFKTEFKRLVMQKKYAYFDQNYNSNHFETVSNSVTLSVYDKNTNILYSL